MNIDIAVRPFPMQIDWDVPIEMDDGVVLRADVYRPQKSGKFPVLISYGPYGKGLHFEDGYKTAWDIMARDFPDTVANTSNAYQNWEVVDPEKWVPHDYICIRVDSRGCGRSPGVIDHHTPREIRDFHDCIEWAGTQPWSSGKVGLAGISYYAANQWRVAGTQPPHLAAVCAWEGYADRYRDSCRHGGITSTFQKNWQAMQVITVQHGVGERGKKSRVTGEWVCGPQTLPPEELARNVVPLWKDLVEHQFDDDYYKIRSADWSKVKVPLLSCGNWGGRACICAGMSRHSFAPPPIRNGSKSTVVRIGRCFTRTMPMNCRGGSSIIFSRATTMAGKPSRGCCSMSAIPAKPSCRVRRTSGRWRERNEPNGSRKPMAKRSRSSPRLVPRRWNSRRWARG